MPSSITLWSGLEHGEETFSLGFKYRHFSGWNTGALCSTLECDEWPFVLQPLQKETVITQTGIRPGRNFTLNEFLSPSLKCLQIPL